MSDLVVGRISRIGGATFINPAHVDPSHATCAAQIAILQSEIATLKDECAQRRIRNKELEGELERAIASAATANGIAGAVFSAIKAAMGSQNNGMDRGESAVA